MNTIDRMNRLMGVHKMVHIIEAGDSMHGYLDILDRKVGIATKGGMERGKFSHYPRNMVGARIRLHERHANLDERQPGTYYFHLGQESDQLTLLDKGGDGIDVCR